MVADPVNVPCGVVTDSKPVFVSAAGYFESLVNSKPRLSTALFQLNSKGHV